MRWDAAQLVAHVVAREHPQKWAVTGLPDTRAALDTPLETVWATVQLALSGANEDTLGAPRGTRDADIKLPRRPTATGAIKSKLHAGRSVNTWVKRSIVMANRKRMLLALIPSNL